MKKAIFVIALAAFIAACGEPSKSIAKKAPEVNTDSIGMADAIHAFYKWYGEAGTQLMAKPMFMNTSGKTATLDLSLLAKHLGEFSKSGAICTEFTQNETIFYRACALAWANEKPGDVLTGFEADRYYCQQDGEPREFLTAGITYQKTGDRATVQLMLDPNGPNGGPRNFEMKQENGKWLLSKNGCESASIH